MKWTEGIDKIGLGLFFIIVLFGVANIYSVDPTSGTKQAVWFGISCFIGGLIFAMRTKYFENMSAVFYVFGILLLLGLYPLGKEVKGQRNWYVFGPISLQPVELVKLAVSLMLANYVSSADFNLKNRKSLITTFVILGIPGILILAIPDVGSLMVFMAFLIALYREGLNVKLFRYGFSFILIFLLSIAFNPLWIVAGVVVISALLIMLNFYRIRWNPINIGLIVGGILLVSGFSFAVPEIMKKLPKHQRNRIEVLFYGEDKKEYRDNIGYNLLYSKTAIGSGGFFGKGYREGSVTQGKFVPEQRTDYIFCTVGEEWGFLGSALLVLCYAVYIGRIYYLAEQQKNTFSRVFGYCFASILMMHFSFNLGMVVGLFPTIGVPLPYFSYGGSSLLAFSLMTFIFFKLNYADKNSLV